MKPINKDDLKRALTKIKTLSHAQESDNSKLIKELLEKLGRESTYKKAFLVAHLDKLIPLATKDIAYFYTEYKTVKAATFNNANYIIDDSLENISLQLVPNDFFRINRQFIVSRNAIKDASIWFSGRLALNLTVSTPERLYVSRSNNNDFKQWLAG
ncbi:MAG: LytTR family transcriptional regulator DNA-binding domain-containing protein [Bacteroidales bacterium]|nr:LytTR family transcriptional regulator DNA-binding domain-containing protein [Bacteroidales bacterium]